ncbi:MAG: two-component sensor histidine kinase [Desulfobacteraceae bacterium]|nr:two-component sensor histidine kinase [Desulfobacteraceae bacterium]MBC2756098.1 two-component sensor histidine kinase [Desulfobacteraceae bacterium]MBC2763745.1 two-component sensor histidine kinase [ANME-2 cluster archaeon]
MNKDKHKKYYQSLTRNMILTAIIVSFTPMLLVICILLQQFRVSYHEKTYAHLSELVQKHKQNIDSFLNEKLANIRFLAVNNSLETLNDNEFLQEKLSTLRRDYGNVFVDLGIVDEKGVQLAYAGPYGLENAEYSDADWFKKARRIDSFISDVFLGLRGYPHFIVAVKKNEAGRDFLVRATIDFMAFNSLVQNLRVGKTGYAFILNREGAFQTNPAMEYQPSHRGYEFFWTAVEKTKNKILITRWQDDVGMENLYAVGSLKDGQWLLIVKQLTADAFSDLKRMFNIAVIIFLIGGLGIVVMAFYTSRRMVRRIRRADQDKENMNEQIIETGKMASIGELAAGIAHEINNPVAIMVEEAGWIGDLLEEEEFAQGENLEEFNRALKQINTQGKRCKEITHKLLSFARKTDATLKDVQLNDIVTEIVSLSAQMAKYNKVSIETQLQKTLPYITISPSEMQQVLLNLINNALDAMEKTGGTIQVSTKISEVEAEHIVIIVEDDGPGIPEANLLRIFDPFFTTKPVGKGTGLGLSICYGIINKMGGKIDVHSTIGKGTRFRIWIPIQK